MDTTTELSEDYAAVSVRLRWAHDSWSRCMREKRHGEALTWAQETCALAARLIAVTERARG